MSRAQRLFFLGIAAAIAVVAVILIAGSGGDEDTDGEQTAASPTATSTETPAPQEASPQETETPTPTATPKPPPLLQSGKVTRLEFTKDDLVRFRVRADEDEEIHVHGYDVEKEVPAGETVPVSFKATIEGIFEIEFHHSEEQIGELRVQPE